MDRLGSLDAEFLHLEDQINHMHIAGVCIFDGTPPTLDELGALVASKLDAIPRYRQVVRNVPLELGRPVWVDDPHFRIEYHLRHTALPAPGGTAELEALMGRLMSQALDRARPLWETWLVEGLEGGRWALIFKVHHCMVDGISGVGLLTALLDLSPDAVEPAEPTPWTPTPAPGTGELLAGAAAGFVHDGAALVANLPDYVMHPEKGLRRAGTLVAGVGRLARNLSLTAPSHLTGSIGPHRAWSHSVVPFDSIRQVRAGLGGTVNDVVLAAVTGAYRRVLLTDGDRVEPTTVTTLVPVSVRSADADGVPDNRVSALLLELPVEVDDPLARLDAVRSRMDTLKVSHMDDAGEFLVRLGNLAPPALLSGATRLGMRAQQVASQRSVTTVTTNVPGPQFPIYCLGRELLGYLPFVPIIQGMRVGTAILSYNGQLAFGVTGDLDARDEVRLLAAAIVDEVDLLVAAAERVD
jgi:WS/DGAT/MGAT family acyltransferase